MPSSGMIRALILILFINVARLAAAADAWPTGLIGYSELQTNLPGGRHANVETMRAMVVGADGTARREIAAQLVDRPDTNTQFVGWSPDGKTAIVGRGWESPENAAWEEEHKNFRFTADS